MKKTIVMLMLLVSTVAFVGCMPTARGGMQSSTEKVWPTEISAAVPKLDEQKIKDVKKLTTSTLMQFEGMTAEDYTAYAKEVEKNGWELTVDTDEYSKGYTKGEERLDVTFKDGIILLDYIK